MEMRYFSAAVLAVASAAGPADGERAAKLAQQRDWLASTHGTRDRRTRARAQIREMGRAAACLRTTADSGLDKRWRHSSTSADNRGTRLVGLPSIVTTGWHASCPLGRLFRLETS